MIYLYIFLIFVVIAIVTMTFDNVSFKQFLKGFFSFKELKKRIKNLIGRLILLIDFLGCVLFGGNIEFISSFLYIVTTYRPHSKAWVYFREAVDGVALMLGDKNHCENSFKNELNHTLKSREFRMTEEEREKLKQQYADK